jgi:hypothetical protein
MIPKERKRSAMLITIAAFGLIVTGMVIGLLWVSMYASK